MEIKITKIDYSPRSQYIKNTGSGTVTSTSSTSSSSDGAALEYINNMFTYDAENQAIKANYNLYSIGDISAYGLGSIVTGGTGGFTDEGLIAFLTANGYNTSATTINYLISGGTAAALDTLNELSAALGNDPNFATTVSNTIGTKWTQDNTKIANWDLAYTNNHTHTNKSVLDGINATTVSNWDSAYTNNHTHSNKSVLDTLTDVNILNWNTAYSNNHTHSNISALNNISDANVLNWNTAYTNNHTHSNKSVLDMLTDVNILNWNTAYTNNHTHSNKSVLDTLTVNNTNVLSHLSIVGGKLQIDIDAYSTGELAAYGLGTTTTGGGTSYDRLDLWSDYNVTKSGYVLSAYLGNDLNTRLLNIEGNGATTISTTGAGNAITSVSKTGTAITFNKNLNFSEVGHTHSSFLNLELKNILGGDINHRLELGFSARDYVNWYEYGGLWKFILRQDGVDTELFKITPSNIFYKDNTVWHEGNFNPSSYLPLSGGTLTGSLSLAEGKNIMLRNSHPYLSGIGYDTYGSECIALWAESAQTRLRWHAGIDMSTMAYGTMMTIVPDFEISKASGVAIGYIGGNTIWDSSNFNPSSYLPLSGGTLTGQLNLSLTGLHNDNFIKFTNDAQVAKIGIRNPYGANGLTFVDPNDNYYKIWHEGNDGAGSGLDADLLDGINSNGFSLVSSYPSTSINNYSIQSGIYTTQGNTTDLPSNSVGNSVIHCNWDGNAANQLFLQFDSDYVGFRRKHGNIWQQWKQLAFTDSNVASATKLQTTRTIWGQPFTGEGDVTGKITFSNYDTHIAMPIGYIGCNTGDSYFWNASNHPIKFGTNDLERMRIAPTGNILIGTSTDSGYKLDVNGDTRSNYMLFKNYNDNGLAGYVGRGSSASNTIYLQGYVGNSVYIGANNNEAAGITINTSNYVGIGTTDPQYKLDVNGTSRFTSQLWVQSSISADSWIYTNAGYGLYNTTFNAGIGFDTNNVVRTYGTNMFRVYNTNADSISTNGGIMAQSVGSDYNTAAFQALGNGAANTVFPTIGFHQPGLYASSIQLRSGGNFYFYQQGASGLANINAQVGTFSNNVVSDGSGTFAVNVSAGNALFATGRIFTGYDANIANSISCSNWFRSNGSSGWFNDTYSGGIHMTDSTYVRIYNYKSLWVDNNIVATGEVTAYSASDKRLKTDIQQLTSSLDIINKLNPVSYKWNSTAKELNPLKTDGEDYGLIAQELEKVLPNLVHTVYNTYKSIDYVKLVPFLVKAVQEQQQQIVNQQQQIEELKRG